jgi:hypothetical protein
MDITDWEQKDGQTVIQCARAEFNEVTFMLGEKSIHAWKQVKETNRHREKLASILFDQRAVIDQQFFGKELACTVVAYNARYRKPKDTRIMTGQMLLPGAAAVVRPPVEAQKDWGDPKRTQKKLVDGIEDGSRPVLLYDPTQRITEVDPDVGVLVRGHGRDITWKSPAGETKLIRKLLVPKRANPKDLMFRFALETKRPKLDARDVTIEPEDWREEAMIRIAFNLVGPKLNEPTEVTVKEFKQRFNPRVPIFVETDGACAANEDKQSPGGWGTILCQENRYCTMFGPKTDTSNNEMEYKAMLEAIQIIPRDTYVIFESDSQGCIDGLTKYRKRWENRGWYNDQGKPVANADIIGQ